MFRPPLNEFALIIPSVAAGTRPSTIFGTSVTPAQNAYGTYAQLLAGASVTDECQEIEIVVSGFGASAANRDGAVTIGFDTAGGTSYTDTISDLVCGPCARTAGDGLPGAYFTFPLRVPAGTSIAAKASVNNVTLTAIRVWCILRGRPSRPDLIRVGSFVRTFGSTPASSNGTTVTPGTASDGTYVQIGSALAEPLWYWEFGYGIDDATMTQSEIAVDIALGDVTNKRVIIQDASVFSNSFEMISKPRGQGRYARGAVGDLVYARAQSAATADSNNSVAVYGVGG
jgi:hypothetical protein